MQTIKFGSKVKEKITGLVGIVTAYATYITGCDQYLVQPQSAEKDTKPAAHWFDVERLEVLKVGVITLAKKPSPITGCDEEAPKK